MASATNTSSVEFSSGVTGNWQRPTHFGVWTHATGTTASQFIGRSALTGSPAAPVTGASVSFAAGALSLTIDETELTNEGAKQALMGITDVALYISLHTGDPGTTGASEFVSSSSPGYARKVVASTGWTIS